MEKESSKIEYFVYARKSSETEDRQVQSLDDQTTRLDRLAGDLSLKVKDLYAESKSAKKPNNRPLFDEMLERIENGEAQGILCWQINRLSRNPVDSGRIQWLLQKGVIKSIQTIDREYRPEDNALLFSIESGVANQFLLDLSKNVKRGIQSKLEKGWRPGAAPVGYINDLANHTIVEDPERFALIRRAWDLMLTGNYTVPQILDKLNNEWGFRSLKRKRTGGTPLAMSGLYKVFTNLFYAGILVHLGQHYQGQHKPMVSLEEYDRVQMLLGRKGKPRPQKHEFAFTGGAIRCGFCGCSYTADKHKKLLISGEIKEHTYYHCTRKTLKIKCTQRKSVTLDNLEEQIERKVEEYEILPEFLQWALDYLNKKHDTEVGDRTKIYEMQHKSLVETQKELDELARMRYRQQVDEEFYIKERDTLKAKIVGLQQKLRETEGRAERWLELSEKLFSFALYAHKEFLTGALARKREILLALGKMPVMLDGKLAIDEPNEWLVPIAEKYPAVEAEYKRLELNKKTLNKTQTAHLARLTSYWQRVVEAVRTWIKANQDNYWVPELAPPV